MAKRRIGTSKKAAAERESRFVNAYIGNGENATRAYMDVYGSTNTGSAAVEGHKLLKRPKVAAMLERRRAELRRKFGLTSDRVIYELARVSYFNPKRLVDQNGKAIPLHRLDDDTAAALASIEVTETEVKGKGTNKVITTRCLKGRPFNKPIALEKSIKILHLYEKPPPPPPEEPGADEAGIREAVKTMAFLLERQAVEAKNASLPKPKKLVRKKLPA
ncbi:MAG: terminase small subunit [Burkholderiales bacterium]